MFGVQSGGREPYGTDRCQSHIPIMSLNEQVPCRAEFGKARLQLQDHPPMIHLAALTFTSRWTRRGLSPLSIKLYDLSDRRWR